MDTRTDLPKVHYATALDWFILITFGYCMASIIQFASVHYFTKVIFFSSLSHFTAVSTDKRLDSFELNQSVHYISNRYILA
jgi:gamma-aminobutyric acid receptor subunit alpha